MHAQIWIVAEINKLLLLQKYIKFQEIGSLSFLLDASSHIYIGFYQCGELGISKTEVWMSLFNHLSQVLCHVAATHTGLLQSDDKGGPRV